MVFHPRLEQPPKVKFYVSQLQSPLPLPKQPNLAFLSGRLTSSNVLGLSRRSSVQRSFFCGDVIAITSWAPDVVNLVRPMRRWRYGDRRWGCEQRCQRPHCVRHWTIRPAGRAPPCRTPHYALNRTPHVHLFKLSM